MRELQRVLAATDASEHGLRAVVTAAACARRSGASLDVVSVLETRLLPFAIKATDYHERFGEELHRKVVAQAEEAGAPDAMVHVRGGLAAPLISKMAEEFGADLVVVGAHPRPAVARFLVGSTAERVIRLAQPPVLVATEGRREPFGRILTAIDLSHQSRRVLEIAAALAQADQAEIRALYVQDRLTPMMLEATLFDEHEQRHHARNQFDLILSEVSLPSELMVSREIREGHAGHEILHEAQTWNADLIMLGTHGFGFFNRMLLGSTSTYVLRHGECATLVVPRQEEAE
ncbi:MAG: universal stress protein [Gemmatimonadota bacterium]|nr:MAG: universal stress protein [Gemmatimonadota bacterium]